MQLSNKREYESTAEFIRMFDHVFDILNVRSQLAASRSRNKFVEPVKSMDDWKFEVRTELPEQPE